MHDYVLNMSGRSYYCLDMTCERVGAKSGHQWADVITACRTEGRLCV
jgi:hypothetical protein